MHVCFFLGHLFVHFASYFHCMTFLLNLKKYETKEAKEEALKKMTNADINFLNYCSDTIYVNIFYSQFLKKSKE